MASLLSAFLPPDRANILALFDPWLPHVFQNKSLTLIKYCYLFGRHGGLNFLDWNPRVCSCSSRFSCHCQPLLFYNYVD